MAGETTGADFYSRLLSLHPARHEPATPPPLATSPEALPAWTGNLTDAAITAAIETLLATKKGVSSHLIAVSTHEGLVRLTGFPDNLLAQQRAEEIALAVRGVTSTVAVRTDEVGDAELQRDVAAGVSGVTDANDQLAISSGIIAEAEFTFTSLSED